LILKDLQSENLSARWCNSLAWDAPTKINSFILLEKDARRSGEEQCKL
jgi:hypothetical protein